jgi:SAM-dependent methyltransferase
MDNQDYEYRGLLAATWDLFRGDTSTWEDKFFYRDLIGQYGQPVLDVGCGTGRLVLDYLADGIDVDGVDNSPEMLAICSHKAQSLGLSPTLFEQGMESLDLPGPYRTIIVPSSSFQLVTDTGLAAQTMQRFYQHLERGGALIMPFMLLRQDGEPQQTEWKLSADKRRAEDGAMVRRWSRARYDVEGQLQHTEDRYEITLNGRVIASESHQRSPATRWYTQDQALRLYREAGFTGLKLYSGFTKEPASNEDTLFSVSGVKA